MKGLTQKERVMKCLEKGEYLDRLTAMIDHGIMELPARISELRAMGIPIKKRNKIVDTRNSGQATVKEYYI